MYYGVVMEMCSLHSFLDDAFRKNLESALRFGNPLLVQVSRHTVPVPVHGLVGYYYIGMLKLKTVVLYTIVQCACLHIFLSPPPPPPHCVCVGC